MKKFLLGLFILAAATAAVYFVFTRLHRPADDTAKPLEAQKDAGLDSGAISRWDIYSGPGQKAAYTVYKDSNVWKVKNDSGLQADAELKTVERSLGHLGRLKKMEPAALSYTDWKKNGLDSAGIRITVYENGKQADSFFISKLFFLNNSISAYYLRRPGSNKVYKVAHLYLDGSVIAKIENFRKVEMVPIDYRLFKKIKVSSPGSDTYYLFEKINGEWSMNGQKSNQNKVTSYANFLSRIQVPKFVKMHNNGLQSGKITIETDYGPIELKAIEYEKGHWTMSSSANIGNYLELNTQQANVIFPLLSFWEK